MSYTIKLLNEKKEEYESLLENINKKFEKKAFRTLGEIENAKESANHFRRVLHDINHSLKKLNE